MPPGERSPRAAHATRTRQKIVDSALRLFAAQGYDETTTDEISLSAGISPRTFFRYFPTKESVLFFGEDDFIRSFTGVYLAQPADVDDVTAMCQAFVVLAPAVSRLRDRIKLYRRAVASSAVLVGRERANHEANASTVARAVAGRRGLAEPDAECDLLARVGVLLLDRALEVWLAGPAKGDLGQSLVDRFAALRGLLCSGGPRTAVDRDSRLS